MPRPKRPPPDPLDCNPIPLSDLETVAKEIMDAPMPDDQRRENREPTPAELDQKFKLERRR